MSETFDAVVIGAGIAGLAVGAELSSGRRVLVLEAEPTHASQSTARSASSWIAGYSGSAVRPFTLASRAWYQSGGDGYVDRSLLARRGLLLISPDAASGGLARAAAGGAERLEPSSAQRLFPGLRDGVIAAATYDPDSQDIDSSTAVEAYRTRLRANHGELQVSAPARAITRAGHDWHVESPLGTAVTPLVVNAAGAWADGIAVLAGVAPVGLTAYRRTACTFAGPDGTDVSSWPLLMDADEGYYLKPESGGFMASPADETPQAPGPTRARMEDVALGLDHVDRITTLAPRSIRSSWAGLRTFAADRAPVLGPDPTATGFAWYAGIGGIGIMTAPAAARAVLSLIDDRRLPEDVIAQGGSAAEVLPDRFRSEG